MKKIVPGLLFLLFFSCVFASTVTRSFSSASILPGADVTVTLAVSMAGEKFYAIDETLPAGGWAIKSQGTGDTSQSGHIKWLNIEGIPAGNPAPTSTSLIYTMTAPGQSGTGTFSGKYMFEGMPAEATVAGQATVTVSIPNCSEGAIMQTCLCGGAQHSNGYCCSGQWSSGTCAPPVECTTSANCSSGKICCTGSCRVPNCGASVTCLSGYSCSSPDSCTAQCQVIPTQQGPEGGTGTETGDGNSSEGGVLILKTEGKCINSRIIITVLDSENSPVEGAAISIMKNNSQAGETVISSDNAGKAFFTASEAEKYSFNAKKGTAASANYSLDIVDCSICYDSKDCENGKLCCAGKCIEAACGPAKPCSSPATCQNADSCTATCKTGAIKKFFVLAPLYIVNGQDFILNVKDSDGNPVYAANVRYAGETRATGEDGSVSFSAKIGQTVILVEKAGFETKSLSSSIISTQPGGSQDKNINIRILGPVVPNKEFVVQVFDKLNKPVQGADVAYLGQKARTDSGGQAKLIAASGSSMATAQFGQDTASIEIRAENPEECEILYCFIPPNKYWPLAAVVILAIIVAAALKLQDRRKKPEQPPLEGQAV
ncbi:MAG: hypothetical protein PHH08_02330 [Candidatus ainarchaeum sp.]|nr:hypothetical protein [Candidatus ainarchaeum sp.]